MHIYGYEDTGQTLGVAAPVLLGEVTVNATAGELRAMAKFLWDSADEMDRMGDNFHHLHLSDRVSEFQASPHFVVAGAGTRA